jgi:hypothetical protein
MAVIGAMLVARDLWLSYNPFPDEAGHEHTQSVLDLAFIIRRHAGTDRMLAAHLVELAMVTKIDYAPAPYLTTPDRETVEEMEARALQNGWPKMRAVCVGQAVFAASLANELDFTWRFAKSLRARHAWLEVKIDGIWYGLNAPDFVENRLPIRPDGLVAHWSAADVTAFGMDKPVVGYEDADRWRPMTSGITVFCALLAFVSYLGAAYRRRSLGA